MIDRHARDRRLLAIGFASYAEYLDSDLWKSIRARVFAEKGRECVCCGSQATEVHHTRYKSEEITGANLRHLHPVCGVCHYKVGFKENGKKRSRCRVQYEFLRLVRRRQAVLNRRQ
jgi:5-methylcytosine-specific restriction endonuclease McrA